MPGRFSSMPHAGCSCCIGHAFAYSLICKAQPVDWSRGFQMKPPSDGPDQTVREAAFRSTRDGLKRPHIYTARKLAPAAVHSILAPPSDRLCISTMHENCTVWRFGDDGTAGAAHAIHYARRTHNHGVNLTAPRLPELLTTRAVYGNIGLCPQLRNGFP